MIRRAKLAPLKFDQVKRWSWHAGKQIGHISWNFGD